MSVKLHREWLSDELYDVQNVPDVLLGYAKTLGELVGNFVIKPLMWRRVKIGCIFFVYYPIRIINWLVAAPPPFKFIF